MWENCIGLQAFILSHTAHIIYELDDEVSETRMNGQNSDIRNICEYSKYEWVMFSD